MEAEFGLDERSALSLFDCLIPVLKEHRKKRILKNDDFSIEDFRTQLKLKQLKWEL